MKTVTTIVCKSRPFKCSERRAGGMGVQSMGCPVQNWRVDSSWETRREGQCVAFTVLECIDKLFQGDCILKGSHLTELNLLNIRQSWGCPGAGRPSQSPSLKPSVRFYLGVTWKAPFPPSQSHQHDPRHRFLNHLHILYVLNASGLSSVLNPILMGRALEVSALDSHKIWFYFSDEAFFFIVVENRSHKIFHYNHLKMYSSVASVHSHCWQPVFNSSSCWKLKPYSLNYFPVPPPQPQP